MNYIPYICHRWSSDAGVAVSLQAAAASSQSSLKQGTVLRTTVRALRAIRRSEASIDSIQLVQSQLSTLSASLQRTPPSTPGVPQLLAAASNALAHAALGVLGSTAVQRAALAVISIVLQLAESGQLHTGAMPSLVELPSTTPGAAEAEWPQEGPTAAAGGGIPPMVPPPACCMIQLLTAPPRLTVQRWQKEHPEGHCKALLFLEDIAFLSLSEAPQGAMEHSAQQHEDAQQVGALLQFVKHLQAAGCTLLLCQKTIMPAAQCAAEDAGILCVPRLGAANAAKLQAVLGGTALQTWEAALKRPASLQQCCSNEQVWCGHMGATGTSVLAIASKVGSIVVSGATTLQRRQVSAAVRAAFHETLQAVCAKPQGVGNAALRSALSPACCAALDAVGLSEAWLQDSCQHLEEQCPSGLLQVLQVSLHAAQVISDEDFRELYGDS